MKSGPVGAELFHMDERTDRYDDGNLAKGPNMLFQVQTPSKITKMETFWHFSNCKHSCKSEGTLFSVINKISHFHKHGFFEHNSIVSAVARFRPCVSTNPNDK